MIVRRKLDKIPDAIGKTLSLFPEDELYRNYKYSAYVTNLNVGMTEVWKLYRMRGDAENLSLIHI